MKNVLGKSFHADDIDTLNKLNSYKYKIRFNNKIVINNFADLIYNAVFLGNKTYYSTGQQQCRLHARRSINDLYRLCDSYNLNINLETLRYNLNKLDPLLEHTYCTTVRKYVMHSKKYYINKSVITNLLNKK